MALLVEKKSGIIDNLGSGIELPSSKKIIKEKVKKSFIKDYLSELKDVDWPTKRQTIIWFFTTILVCVTMGTLILSFDQVFKAGFKFIECSSPKGNNLQVGQCFSELPKNIFGGKL
jgi:preprotein translocase SecE subunit